MIREVFIVVIIIPFEELYCQGSVQSESVSIHFQNQIIPGITEYHFAFSYFLYNFFK
jgi:hypothetical protein